MQNFDPSLISWTDLLWAFSLIVLTLGIVRYLKLDLEKVLAIGALRTFVQLIALGYVFHFIFTIDSPLHFFALLTVISLFAGFEGQRRQTQAIPRYFLLQVSVVIFSTAIVLGLILGVILDLHPWYNPVVSIPLGGMIMGQVLNSSSLAANNLSRSLRDRQQEIELRLALGANRIQATLPVLRESVHSAMIPAINSMNTVGIVSIPGVLVGSLLAGLQPLVAIKYQIMVMYLWVAGTAIATASMGFLICVTYLNAHHQLRRDLLRQER